MIYTITLNPSIDYVIYANDFQMGALNRATHTHKFPGGKGINVSRVLKTLNISSTATGFIGGFPGAFIKDALKHDEIATEFIEVKDDTRINVKLKTDNETEINGPGPSISDSNYAELVNKLKTTNSDDIVVLAGSVPSSIKRPIYQEIAELLQETGATLVVDTEKVLMETVLPFKPKFIKPNKTELEEMFKVRLNTDDEIIECANALMDKGAQSVIVSLGGEGAIYVDDEIKLKASVPSGQVVNTVGSGDSTVAGMIAGLMMGRNKLEAFKLAVSCGTATAFSADLAKQSDIKKIIQEVEIKHL